MNIKKIAQQQDKRKKSIPIYVTNRYIVGRSQVEIKYVVGDFSLSEILDRVSDGKQINDVELQKHILNKLNEILSKDELSTEEKVELSKYIHKIYGK